MIINHDRKMAISFAPKTASTSIRTAALANGFLEVGSHHSMFFGAIPPSYSNVVTIRHPYDRAVSLYWHRLWEISKLVSGDPTNPVLPLSLEGGYSFIDFVRWAMSEESTDFYRFSQRSWYRGADIRDLMIVRVEYLEVAVEDVLKFEIAHLNKTNHRPTSSYFSEVAKRLVDEWFADDFDDWGYRREVRS